MATIATTTMSSIRENPCSRPPAGPMLNIDSILAYSSGSSRHPRRMGVMQMFPQPTRQPFLSTRGVAPSMSSGIGLSGSQLPSGHGLQLSPTHWLTPSGGASGITGALGTHSVPSSLREENG